MSSVALLPAVAILGGVWAGVIAARPVPAGPLLLALLLAVAAVAWHRRRARGVVAAVTLGYAIAGASLGASAARRALDPPVRSALADDHPVVLRARLVEDAAPREFGASMRAEALAVTNDGRVRPVSGGVRLTVSGGIAARRAPRWRAGRVIEAPVTLRRPARFLNEGVGDFERALALDGVALLGSVKSGLLVEVVERGSRFAEAAAALRARVRDAVSRRVGGRDPVAGAIVTAILIGDRTALPDEVRERLQAAGTYHVIAISGGNIAILAALLAGVLAMAGVRGRLAALVVILGLAAYAGAISAGPSVWRATLTAVVYMAARLLDQRSPPWNAIAVSAALLACAAPLDVLDVGFALTFGATAAILEAARRVHPARRGIAAWVAGSLAASVATELVLLPITASAFSRVTSAGLLLNLLAVPLMTVAQVAGMAAVCADGVAWAGEAAGAAAAAAARGLVESARLVEAWPWLALRVPPPAAWLVVTYYLALGGALWGRRCRPAAIATAAAAGAAILCGASAWRWSASGGEGLRLTVFDVGQGDAALLQFPDGRTLMVDAGGAGFDGAAFDIGGRVLAPALWARGVTRLDALAITHADPDHIGGALALVRDFAPREIWQGIAVPRHPPSSALAAAAAGAGLAMRTRLAGWRAVYDGVEVRVLHPPAPDWERPRVRNDDSLVLQVRDGDVAILLSGDIGAEVEAALLPLLAPARVRILKVAHHGSRTSTSQALLDAWRPQIALISCGRDNRFGHPAPEVLARLAAAGVRVYRTDRDGQITVETEGGGVRVRTFVGHEATR